MLTLTVFPFPLPTALVLNLWLLGAILAGNSIFTSPTPAPSRTNENSLTYNTFFFRSRLGYIFLDQTHAAKLQGKSNLVDSIAFDDQYGSQVSQIASRGLSIRQEVNWPISDWLNNIVISGGPRWGLGHCLNKVK